MFTLTMNDAAVAALGLLTDQGAVLSATGVVPELAEKAERGIVRRADVLTWADSNGDAHAAPAPFSDLTGWECHDSSFHLEDHIQVPTTTVDSAPVITEAGQRTLLEQGLAFTLRFSRSVCALPEATSVRCIVAVNHTNGTFRFHQIRAEEDWNEPDLDAYTLEKVIVVDLHRRREGITGAHAKATP